MIKFLVEEKVKSKSLNVIGTVIYADVIENKNVIDIQFRNGIIQRYSEYGELNNGSGIVDLILLPDFRLDDIVQVIDNNRSVLKRHFKCFSIYGDVIVFGKGKSSKTVEHGDLDEFYSDFGTVNEDLKSVKNTVEHKIETVASLDNSITTVAVTNTIDDEFSIHEDIVINAYLGTPFIEGAILKVNKPVFKILYKEVVTNFRRGYSNDDCNINSELGGGIITFKGLSFKALHDINGEGDYIIYLPKRAYMTLCAVCPEYFFC